MAKLLNYLREVFLGEPPQCYERIADNDAWSREARWKLTDLLVKEMESHRARQITMFREAIIVMGLVTWGTYLALCAMHPDDSHAHYFARVATLLCFAVAILGSFIIIEYRRRIYHLRKRREDLLRGLRPEYDVEPSDCDRKTAKYTWLFPPTSGLRTSLIYAGVLLIVALLASRFIDRAADCAPTAATANQSTTDNGGNGAQTENGETTDSPEEETSENNTSATTGPPRDWYQTALIIASAGALVAAIILIAVAIRRGMLTNKKLRRHLAALAAISERSARVDNAQHPGSNELIPPLWLLIIYFEQLMIKGDLGSVNVDRIQKSYAESEKAIHPLIRMLQAGRP